jgi:Cys-rich protein (TIGR01571 family)
MTCWKFLFLYLLLLATFVAMTIASTVYGVEHDGTEPLWLFVLVALGWCAWIAMYVVDVWVRGRIRARFRIAGDWCTDCALVTRCCFCTTCQEAHHVDRATRAGATYASDFI